MKVGDRVKLSPLGRKVLAKHYPHKGVVVKPGLSRASIKLRVLPDGSKRPRTFATAYWEPDA